MLCGLAGCNRYGPADPFIDEPDPPFEPVGPFADCAPFSALGPHPVGVRGTTIAGHDVEVLYPAVGRGAVFEAYDLRDWLPPEDAALISDEVAPLFEYPAYRDAPTDGATYPLVLFSHGFGGYRLQSSALVATIASWGFVVVAPEHDERNLTRFLELGSPPMEDDSAATLTQILDALQADPGDLAGHIDLDRIALLGHSVGGTAAMSAGSDARVDLVVAWATGGMTQVPPIEAPSVVFAGGADRLSSSGSVRELFNTRATPRQFVSVDGLGHLGFADLCLIGRDEGGALKIAQDAGVAVPALLRVLASDGCLAQDRPPEEGWPLVTAVTIGNLDHRLRDGSPVDASELNVCFGELLTEMIVE